jgi:hypothetical protein
VKKLEQIRVALADYMAAEGCSCCRDDEAYADARKRLGALLNVPQDIFGKYVFSMGLNRKAK